MAADETEIASMLVRLTGDSVEYEAMIKRAEEATERIKTVEEEHAEAEKVYNQIRAQTRTVQERYNEKVDELNRLWEMGAIDQDTYNRAFKQYEEMLPKVEKKVGALERAFKTVTDAMKKGVEGVKSSFNKLKELASSTLGLFASLGAVGGLGAAFKSFDETEKSWAHLTNAVEVNGAAVDTTIKRYKEFIEETERTSLATKGQIRGLLTQAAGYGIVGSRAEELVRNTLALASSTGKSADETFRAALGLQMHNAHMVKAGLGMGRQINDAKAFEIANKRLAGGFKNMAEELDTPGGKIEKLKRSLAGLTFEVGAIVAEAITPFVDRLKELSDWFNRLDPSVKKVVAVFLTVLGVLVALGPVFAAVGAAVGGVISFLGGVFAVVSTVVDVLAALLAALFTPLGLVVAGLIAVLYATVDWAAVGGAMLGWFGARWDELKTHFMPAIKGITDALKAGNIKLAFEILWAQIQLTFATGIKPLREMWVGFVFLMKELWINVTSSIKSTWESTTTWIAKQLVKIGKLVGIYDEDESRQIQDALQDDLKRSLANVERERTNELNKAANASADQMKGIQDNLKNLEKERDRLTAKAAEEAANVKPMKDPAVNITAGYERAAKAAKELKGIIVGSAADIRETIKYQERLSGIRNYTSTSGTTGVQVGSPKDVKSLAKQDKTNELLQDIRDNLKGAPKVNIQPGGDLA